MAEGEAGRGRPEGAREVRHGRQGEDRQRKEEDPAADEEGRERECPPAGMGERRGEAGDHRAAPTGAEVTARARARRRTAP